MKIEDLTGEARATYDVWLSLGWPEERALAEAATLQHEAYVIESMATIIAANRGISREAALEQARLGNRGPGALQARAHPFDRLVEAFKVRGMSPEAARQAAIGRNRTESEARAELHEAHRIPVADGQAPDPHTVPMQEAVRAAQHFHGYDLAAAQAWVTKRLDEANPVDRAAWLKDYSKNFGTGRTAAQLTESRNSPSGAAQLREVVAPPSQPNLLG